MPGVQQLPGRVGSQSFRSRGALRELRGRRREIRRDILTPLMKCKVQAQVHFVCVVKKNIQRIKMKMDILVHYGCENQRNGLDVVPFDRLVDLRRVRGWKRVCSDRDTLRLLAMPTATMAVAFVRSHRFH